MKRFAFAAALVLLVGAAFSVSFIMSAFAAQETYPAGTDSVTIYGLGVVEVDDTDSTATTTGDFVYLKVDATTGPRTGVLMRFPLDAVPSGKAIVKVAFHVTGVSMKALSNDMAIDVSRLMQSYDSTAVTYTRRSASAWWPSDDIFTAAGFAADTTYESSASSIRPRIAVLHHDGSPANGEELRADITGAVRAWYSGLWANHGLLLRYNLPVGFTYNGPTVGTSTSATPPYIKVYYTDAGGGGKTVQGPVPFGIR